MKKSSESPTGREQLSAWLAEKEMSQTQLCDLLGDVSTTAVSRWLSGERTPSLEMAVRLERETGISHESWLSAEHRRAG